MKTEQYRNRLENLDSLLQSARFLLANEQFPIYNWNHELYPDEIPLVFESAHIDIAPVREAILDPGGEIVAVDNYLRRNFPCTVCNDRSRGIRGFLQRGRKKLLILHYTGESGLSGSSFIKKNPKALFRTQGIEDCFRELIDKNFQYSYQEFFFQEYPACHFPPSDQAGVWERRAANCDIQILETVRKEGIRAILVLGSSAILRFNREFCQKNQGKVMKWKFGDGTHVPFCITRSPEALLHAKNQDREKFQSILDEMSAHIQGLNQTVGGF